MSYSNANIGTELNNRDKFYAAIKPQQQPQVQQEAQQLAVQAKDQKASGVSWTKSGNGKEDVISTQEENDTLSLSSTSVSLTSTDTTPLTARVADTVKSGLNSFRRGLVDGLYGKIEAAVRKEYSYDAMQARFGASDLDAMMSKLFLRLGPEMLATLGEEDPAEKISAIKARVIGQLKGENGDKMTSCVESEIRLKVYGNA